MGLILRLVLGLTELTSAGLFSSAVIVVVVMTWGYCSCHEVSRVEMPSAGKATHTLFLRPIENIRTKVKFPRFSTKKQIPDRQPQSGMSCLSRNSR